MTTLTFNGWKYAHYFDFLELKDNKNVVVKCKLCVSSTKTLSCARNTTSNLLKHLLRQHSNMKLVEREPDRDEHAAKGSQPAAKQRKLDFNGGQQQAMCENEVTRLVARYVVDEMLPISTIDSPSFRQILGKIPVRGNKKPPGRKTFASYLDREYTLMEAELKKAFNEIDYVSTTADIWTANNKSFLGMTVHWINGTTLQREKAAVACKRIRGRHTHDVIAAEIEQVHSFYGLSNKVTATVTDNGSNFVKAFKMYQPLDSDSEGHEEEENEVTFTNVADALYTEGDGEFFLPPHHRCASHTMNLISTNDVEKWLTASPDTKATYRSGIAKCTALWTKASRSTVASELVEEVSRRKLLVPTSTRWNSFFEAVTRITEIPISDLNGLCVKLGIKGFTDKEYQFLGEYTVVMKPLTVALDILQGEDNCFYGTILPTLEVLMSKTLALKVHLSKMTAGLPDVIVQVSQTM